MTLYAVNGYKINGALSGEVKIFTTYKAAQAFKKTCNEENEDPNWKYAMILYKYEEQKDGSLKEIYIGPSNW